MCVFAGVLICFSWAWWHVRCGAFFIITEGFFFPLGVECSETNFSLSRFLPHSLVNLILGIWCCYMVIWGSSCHINKRPLSLLFAHFGKSPKKWEMHKCWWRLCWRDMAFIFWACGCFDFKSTTDLHRTEGSASHQTSYSFKARVDLNAKTEPARECGRQPGLLTVVFCFIFMAEYRR